MNVNITNTFEIRDEISFRFGHPRVLYMYIEAAKKRSVRERVRETKSKCFASEYFPIWINIETTIHNARFIILIK